jgi:hypothetical protein
MVTEEPAKDKPTMMNLAGEEPSTRECAARSLREFLRRIATPLLTVGHGDVVDAEGRRLRQTPVIIAATTHAFALDDSSKGVFFVEGLRAAGEVRPELSAADWEDRARNASMFKSLRLGRRRSTRPRKARIAGTPPWFLLAHSSSIPLCDIASLLGDCAIDAVFLLDQGHVIEDVEGRGPVPHAAGDRGRVMVEFASWIYPDAPTEYVDRALRPMKNEVARNDGHGRNVSSGGTTR